MCFTSLKCSHCLKSHGTNSGQSDRRALGTFKGVPVLRKLRIDVPWMLPAPSTHSPWPEWVEIESGILNWYLVCSSLTVAAALGVSEQLYLCL